MTKISAIIIDPDTQSIRMSKIENSLGAFKAIVGESVNMKRLSLEEFAEVLEDEVYDSQREDLYYYGVDQIQGINIILYGEGQIYSCKKFMIGNHRYTECYGKAIITGADSNYEDVNIPYSEQFFKKIITWGS
jgi:hypothetical protein